MHGVLNIALFPSQPQQNTPFPSTNNSFQPYLSALWSSHPRSSPFPPPYQQIIRKQNRSLIFNSNPLSELLIQALQVSLAILFGFNHISYPSLDQYNWPCVWCPIPERHHIQLKQKNYQYLLRMENYQRNLERYFELSLLSQDRVMVSFACFNMDSYRYLRKLEAFALASSSVTLTLSSMSWALVFSQRFSSTMMILCVGADEAVNSCFNCFISASFCVIFLVQLAAAQSIFILSSAISFLITTTADFSTFGTYIQLYCLTSPILFFLYSFLTRLILFCSFSISTCMFRLLAFMTQLQHSLPCSIPDEIKLYLAQISLKLPVCWSTLFLNSSTRI